MIKKKKKNKQQAQKIIFHLGTYMKKNCFQIKKSEMKGEAERRKNPNK